MKFHLYQLVVLVLSSAMIFQGVKNYVSGKSGQNLYKVMVRVLVWGGILVIGIFPGFTNFFAKAVGMEGNINAVILTGFLLIFLMIFKLLSAIERLEQNISELTRKESLGELKK